MRKTKRIPFNDFMKGMDTEKKQITIKSLCLGKGNFYFSISPFIFLDGGMIAVVASGVVAITCTLIENAAIKAGDFEKGDRIAFFGQTILLTTGIGAVFYFLVWKNPMLRFL
jgi:hypothetical protein